MFQDFRYSDIVRPSRSDEVLKLKNFKKDAILKLFKLTNQERYEHVGLKVTSSQDGKVYKMAKRDYAWLMISRCSRSHSYIQVNGTSSILKSMITTPYSQDKEKKKKSASTRTKTFIIFSLAEVAAYDPSVEERYVSAILALRDLDFNFLSQLESQKDASIACIMDSLRLKGSYAETPEVSWLQPACEQLLLHIHWKEDNAIIGETSLSDSLNVVYDHVQKVKKGALSHCLSISEAMGPLVDPLSSENFVGGASTSSVPATAASTTAFSVTNTNVSFIPPISVVDYEVLNVEPRREASHSPKIIFKQGTLETSPKHPTTS
ncbi:hypothetical protein Tco_0594156 [Tanacetum coccineum]